MVGGAVVHHHDLHRLLRVVLGPEETDHFRQPLGSVTSADHDADWTNRRHRLLPRFRHSPGALVAATVDGATAIRDGRGYTNRRDRRRGWQPSRAGSPRTFPTRTDR